MKPRPNSPIRVHTLDDRVISGRFVAADDEYVAVRFDRAESRRLAHVPISQVRWIEEVLT